MPLDEYAFYGRHADKHMFEAAAQAVIAECMRGRGLTAAPVQITGDPGTDLDDRRFGIWEETRAARYGWGYPPSPLDAAITRARASGGPEWAAAYDSCNESDADVVEAINKITPPQAEYLGSVASRLEGEALAHARRDPRWREARVPWADCLTAAGLTPEEGETYTSRQSTALLDNPAASRSEEGIRLASIEARCNSETGLTQTLADLEAAQQRPLIAENEAALTTEKTQKQKLLNAAREYLATHG
ncbi:hypothetical protein [Mycetocola spongiae]|uniref:hypothetical protein n=1 Tax=Mycetocola spongiae TaxID=2859226 RepID=UPI001CF42EEE|nr:hypothetical protein [Mycetocola spongiae]UCR87886.1 hypothetical protein KXZ72_07585 [Mycetocola spongiae]